MAETTDYDLVLDEIASFLGSPKSGWDSRTSSDVESAIRKGIDAVVHNALSHQWMWMRPNYRFMTSDGQRRYTLPIDFEQFVSHLSFDGENFQYPSITQLPAGRLQQMYTEYCNTGVPTNYAIEVLAHDGETQQHQRLVLHPTPDDSYQLVGIYQVGPIRSLSDDRPWLPGGPEHKELFVASILAAIESKFMDQSITDKQTNFQAALAGAVGRDYRKAPRNLGQMVGQRGRGRDYYRWKLDTTYEGSQDV